MLRKIALNLEMAGHGPVTLLDANTLQVWVPRNGVLAPHDFALDPDGALEHQLPTLRFQNAVSPDVQATFTILSLLTKWGACELLDEWYVLASGGYDPLLHRGYDRVAVSHVCVVQRHLWLDNFELNRQLLLAELHIMGNPVWHSLNYKPYNRPYDPKPFTASLLEQFHTRGRFPPMDDLELVTTGMERIARWTRG